MKRSLALLLAGGLALACGQEASEAVGSPVAGALECRLHRSLRKLGKLGQRQGLWVVSVLQSLGYHVTRTITDGLPTVASALSTQSPSGEADVVVGGPAQLSVTALHLLKERARGSW